MKLCLGKVEINFLYFRVIYIAVWGYYILAGVYAVLTIILDTITFTRLFIGFEIASIALIGYVIVMLAIHLRENKIQNLLSFLGIAVVGLLGINDILLHFDITWLGFIGGAGVRRTVRHDVFDILLYPCPVH